MWLSLMEKMIRCIHRIGHSRESKPELQRLSEMTLLTTFTGSESALSWRTPVSAVHLRLRFSPPRPQK